MRDAATRRNSDKQAASEPALAHLVMLGALSVSAFGQGGYYAPTRLLGAGLVVATLLFGRRYHREWPLALPLACLAGWAVVSAVANGRPTSAFWTVLLIGCVAVVL